MRNLPMRVTAAFVFVALAAIAGCSHSGRQERGAKTRSADPQFAAIALARIDVEGGLLPMSVNDPGTVASVPVRAGDHVRRGAPLLRLDAGTAEDAVAIAKGRLARARANAHLIALQLEQARRHAKTLSQAFNDGAGSGQQASDARYDVKKLAAQQLAAQAAVTIAHGELDRARHLLARHTLRAPMDADVITVHVHPGESVSAQSGPLLMLLPSTPPIIDAELNRNFVHAVHPGMQAQVVLDSDGSTLLGMAHVVRVGRVFGPSTLIADPSRRANTRTVSCVLRFDKPSSLRVGERVIVRILAAQRG